MTTATLAADEMTVEEFLTHPDNERYELVNGVMKERPTSYESAWIGNEVAYALTGYAKSHGGFACGDGAEFKCFGEEGKNARRPDASYIRPGRLEAPPRGPCEVVPDVVLEVLSPGDRIFDHREKMRAYRAAGVPVVLVLDPAERTAELHRDAVVRQLPEDGVLELKNEMPGFRLELSKVWPPAADA